MLEPLTYFLSRLGYNRLTIRRWVAGDKYIAVQLTNGQIGVCATLGMPVKLNEGEISNPDLSNPMHRLFLNAYINAHYNISQSHFGSGDIFQLVDFASAGRIVMVGYFKPLVRKFDQAGIPLRIFDRHNNDERILPIHQQTAELKQADVLILTATTLANATFLPLLEWCPRDCKVYLLGPSAILHPDMQQYAPVAGIFGTVFPPEADQVLNVVSAGFGTRQFSPFGEKVYLQLN